MAAKDNPVVDLMEEEEEEWPEVRVQNPEEAEWYTEKINNVFDNLSTLIHQDMKTALGQTIQNFKKNVARQWETMGDTDMDVILRTIKDPTAVYLCSIWPAGESRWWTPPKELPTGQEFIRQLPEWARWAEETAFIVDIFDHTARAHEHLSEVCANVSALTKVMDKATLLSVINGAVHPLVQLNIPEGFLNPVEDKKAKTTEEEKREKVRKTVLPIPNTPCLAHEPWNSPTHILTAAVWLKMSKKYFNEGTAKEVCECFDVWAKQLLRVLTGQKYLGGTQACKHKATKELPVRQKKSDS